MSDQNLPPSPLPKGKGGKRTTSSGAAAPERTVEVGPLARVQARRGVLMQQAGQAQQELERIQQQMAAAQQRAQELVGTLNAINGGLAELEQVEKMLQGGDDGLAA